MAALNLDEVVQRPEIRKNRVQWTRVYRRGRNSGELRRVQRRSWRHGESVEPRGARPGGGGRRWALYRGRWAKGRGVVADRGGFQFSGDDDLLTPRRYPQVRCTNPNAGDPNHGGGIRRRWASRAVDLIQLSYCTMGRPHQLAWQSKFRAVFLQILHCNFVQTLYQSCRVTNQLQSNYRDQTHLSTGSCLDLG